MMIPVRTASSSTTGGDGSGQSRTRLGKPKQKKKTKRNNKLDPNGFVQSKNKGSSNASPFSSKFRNKPFVLPTQASLRQILATYWDSGSKLKRRRLLETFVQDQATPSKHHKYELLKDSLLLTRILSWVRLTYLLENHNALLMLQLQSVYVFLQAGCSERQRFIGEFVEAGGVISLVSILQEVPDETIRLEACRLMLALSEGGSDYKEIICEHHGVKSVISCMKEAEQENTVLLCERLITNLGMMNPRYSSVVHEELLSMFQSDQVTVMSKKYAAQALYSLLDHSVAPKSNNNSNNFYGSPGSQQERKVAQTQEDEHFKADGRYVDMIVHLFLVNGTALEGQVHYEAYRLLQLLATSHGLEDTVIDKLALIAFGEWKAAKKQKESVLTGSPPEACAVKMMGFLAKQSRVTAEKTVMFYPDLVDVLLASLVAQNYELQHTGARTLHEFCCRVDSVASRCREKMGEEAYTKFMSNPNSVHEGLLKALQEEQTESFGSSDTQGAAEQTTGSGSGSGAAAAAAVNETNAEEQNKNSKSKSKSKHKHKPKDNSTNTAGAVDEKEKGSTTGHHLQTEKKTPTRRQGFPNSPRTPRSVRSARSGRVSPISTGSRLRHEDEIDYASAPVADLRKPRSSQEMYLPEVIPPLTLLAGSIAFTQKFDMGPVNVFEGFDVDAASIDTKSLESLQDSYLQAYVLESSNSIAKSSSDNKSSDGFDDPDSHITLCSAPPQIELLEHSSLTELVHTRKSISARTKTGKKKRLNKKKNKSSKVSILPWSGVEMKQHRKSIVAARPTTKRRSLKAAQSTTMFNIQLSPSSRLHRPEKHDNRSVMGIALSMKQHKQKDIDPSRWNLASKK